MPSRRQFIQGLAVAAGGLILLPPPAASAKKLAIPLDKAEKLKTVGGSATLMARDHIILFVRDSESSVRAINPVCSHQKCTVAYSLDTKQIECPCHKSTFDLDGKVLKGPASKPLTTYPAEISGDCIVVTVD